MFSALNSRPFKYRLRVGSHRVKPKHLKKNRRNFSEFFVFCGSQTFSFKYFFRVGHTVVFSTYFKNKWIFYTILFYDGAIFFLSASSIFISKSVKNLVIRISWQGGLAKFSYLRCNSSNFLRAGSYPSTSV